MSHLNQDMLIKPFQGIYLKDLNMRNNIGTFSNEIESLGAFHQNFITKSINSKLLSNQLLREEKLTYYLCRYTSGINIYEGIIAQLNCSYLNTKILAHEEITLNHSVETSDSFFQISPTVLFHENCVQLESYVKNYMHSKKCDLFFSDNDDIYQLWKIKKSNRFEKLCNSIENLYIADGHHRINFLHNTKKNALAYIVPASQIKSFPIMRKYINLDDFSIKRILSNIKSNHHIRIDFSERFFNKLINKNTFSFLLPKRNIYYNLTKKSNFLEAMNLFKKFNFNDRGIVNFVNSKIPLEYQKQKEFNDKLNKGTQYYAAYLFIPSITSENLLSSFEISLPTKSTWLEPKIKSGVIIMETF